MGTSNDNHTKSKIGRPNEYNKELTEEICEKVRNGESIKRVLSSDDRYPTFQTWCNWKRDNIELFDQYIKAIQDKSETCVENIYNTMQQLKDGEIESKDARVMIDTYKWLAGKFYPKMFGVNSTIDVTSAGKEITQQIVQFQLPDNNRDVEE